MYSQSSAAHLSDQLVECSVNIES